MPAGLLEYLLGGGTWRCFTAAAAASAVLAFSSRCSWNARMSSRLSRLLALFFLSDRLASTHRPCFSGLEDRWCLADDNSETWPRRHWSDETVALEHTMLRIIPSCRNVIRSLFIYQYGSSCSLPCLYFRRPSISLPSQHLCSNPSASFRHLACARLCLRGSKPC